MTPETRAALRCDCEWVGTTGIEPCGCGEHGCRLYRDDVWHYDGKHWRADCLIRALAPVSTAGWQAQLTTRPVPDVLSFVISDKENRPLIRVTGHEVRVEDLSGGPLFITAEGTMPLPSDPQAEKDQ